MTAREYNFDGIVGPTHNYAGLSFGNVASARHQNQVSNPRAAALQGLEKMRQVHAMGIGQAVLPPLRRPRLDVLRSLGLRGQTDEELLRRAWDIQPTLVASVFSASSMWTANAATVSPSMDAQDSRLHLTPANLTSTFHRSLEVTETQRLLQAIFADTEHFFVHPALPSSAAMADEGAANHTRFAPSYGDPGMELFVFGFSAWDRARPAPQRFPARQSLESCAATARNHKLDPSRTFFIQQNPVAIDAGVFHNDVIAVGNLNVLLYHEHAFLDPNFAVQLKQCFESTYEHPFHAIAIQESEMTLEQCVASYLFNSQILTLDEGGMLLLCPSECEALTEARQTIERIIADPNNPVEKVCYLDLRQSMNNGGGPACLRLRVVLNDEQRHQVLPGVMFSPQLHGRLVSWVEKYYRSELAPDDLLDPKLILEVHQAIDALQTILGLPAGTL